MASLHSAIERASVQTCNLSSSPQKEIKAPYQDVKWEKTKLDKEWKVQECLPFQRAIRRPIPKISELESTRTGMRVTSSEGKVFSPNCEVENGTKDDGGTMEVQFV